MFTGRRNHYLPNNRRRTRLLGRLQRIIIKVILNLTNRRRKTRQISGRRHQNINLSFTSSTPRCLVRVTNRHVISRVSMTSQLISHITIRGIRLLLVARRLRQQLTRRNGRRHQTFQHHRNGRRLVHRYNFATTEETNSRIRQGLKWSSTRRLIRT